MRWRDAVLASLQSYSSRKATQVIRRCELVEEELPSILRAVGSKGLTPQQTLSRVLQDLRDERILEFIDRGTYLLLDPPIDIEREALSPIAIDMAIKANRLRIGLVPTGSIEAIQRQRQGQERVRALTLSHYDSCCAVCDIDEPALLVASHIVPWAEAPEHRGDLTNVICLCRIHDALFEAGYWSLYDDFNLIKNQTSYRAIALVLGGMTAFRPPRDFGPAARFLKRHRTRSGLVSQ